VAFADGGSAAAQPLQAPRSPQSPADLFRVFTRLALQGFGGVLPVAQRTLVEQERWLTREQFLEMLSIAQILPGPNIVNLSLILGDRHFGWRGALAAVSGVMLAPLAVVLLLALLAQQWRGQPLVNDALRGMGVVAAGLVLSTAIRLVGGLRRNAMGRVACAAFLAATVLTVGVLRWPLVGVIAALGGAALALAVWRLKP
jgi:chromate transporter